MEEDSNAPPRGSVDNTALYDHLGLLDPNGDAKLRSRIQRDRRFNVTTAETEVGNITPIGWTTFDVDFDRVLAAKARVLAPLCSSSLVVVRCDRWDSKIP